MLGEVRKEESLNAGQLFTMDLSAGGEGGRREGNILAMKEATGIQFRGQKEGEGRKDVLSAWFAPKRRGFSLSKHLARAGIRGRGGIYLTGISSGKLDNRIQPFL